MAMNVINDDANDLMKSEMNTTMSVVLDLNLCYQQKIEKQKTFAVSHLCPQLFLGHAYVTTALFSRD